MTPFMWNQWREIFTPKKRINVVGSRVLQGVAGFFLLYRVFTELPLANYFWGLHGIPSGSLLHHFGPTGAMLEHLLNQPSGVHIILIIHTLAALLLFLGRWGGLAAFVAASTFMILNARTPSIGDGGDNLLQILLFYMVFLNTSTKEPGQTRIFFHNLAVYSIIAQIIIVYYTAGTSKLMGESWTSGKAMYQIAQLQWFSLPFFGSLFKNPYLAILASYATIVYQIGFPYLIFTRYKILAIAFGIILHLGILVMMGLVTFSSVMIGSELMLLTDTDYTKIRIKFNSVIKNIGQIVQKFHPIQEARRSEDAIQ